MDLFTIMTILGGAVTIAGTLGGWILSLQGKLIKMESRIEALELGSNGNLEFLKELRNEFRSLREIVDKRMEEFEKDLNAMVKDVAILADRESRRDHRP